MENIENQTTEKKFDKNWLYFFVVNSIFLVLTIATDVLYITLGNAYVFKTLASAVFVLCC